MRNGLDRGGAPLVLWEVRPRPSRRWRFPEESYSRGDIHGHGDRSADQLRDSAGSEHTLLVAAAYIFNGLKCLGCIKGECGVIGIENIATCLPQEGEELLIDGRRNPSARAINNTVAV